MNATQKWACPVCREGYDLPDSAQWCCQEEPIKPMRDQWFCECGQHWSKEQWAIECCQEESEES